MSFTVEGNMKFSAEITDMKFSMNVGYVQPKKGVGQAVDSAAYGNLKMGISGNAQEVTE